MLDQPGDPPPSRVFVGCPVGNPEEDILAGRTDQAEEDMGLVQREMVPVVGCSIPSEEGPADNSLVGLVDHFATGPVDLVDLAGLVVANCLVDPADKDLDYNHRTQPEGDAGERRRREVRRACCRPFRLNLRYGFCKGVMVDEDVEVEQRQRRDQYSSKNDGKQLLR